MSLFLLLFLVLELSLLCRGCIWLGLGDSPCNRVGIPGRRVQIPICSLVSQCRV